LKSGFFPGVFHRKQISTLSCGRAEEGLQADGDEALDVLLGRDQDLAT